MQQNQNQPPQQIQQKPLAMPPKPAATAPATSGSNSAKYAGMIVIGIIAGVLIAWGWSSLRSSPASTTNGTATTTSSTTGTSTGGSNLGVDVGTASLGSASLSIATPQPAGNSVAVASAVVSAPTWVVIYEDNAGHPGNALGAALFFPGTPSGTVELLRATTAGKSYLAAEQLDNGDRKFSLKTDQLVTVDGQVQWVTFETK